MRAPGRGEIADEGANQAALVDSFVLIEALVLGRQEGFLHMLRNVSERHPDPPLVLFEHLGKAFAPAIEHHARAGKSHALELCMIGQIGRRLVVEIDDLAQVHGRYGDVLVLAELPVGRLQIGEIDAAKRLVLAGDRLWVVHGGG